MGSTTNKSAALVKTERVNAMAMNLLWTLA
jgi:hypothetical protein